MGDQHTDMFHPPFASPVSGKTSIRRPAQVLEEAGGRVEGRQNGEAEVGGGWLTGLGRYENLQGPDT